MVVHLSCTFWVENVKGLAAGKQKRSYVGSINSWIFICLNNENLMNWQTHKQINKSTLFFGGNVWCAGLFYLLALLLKRLKYQRRSLEVSHSHETCVVWMQLWSQLNSKHDQNQLGKEKKKRSKSDRNMHYKSTFEIKTVWNRGCSELGHSTSHIMGNTFLPAYHLNLACWCPVFLR